MNIKIAKPKNLFKFIKLENRYDNKIQNPKTTPVNPIGKTKIKSFKKENVKNIGIKYLFLFEK
jgi:hypothetical protein